MCGYGAVCGTDSVLETKETESTLLGECISLNFVRSASEFFLFLFVLFCFVLKHFMYTYSVTDKPVFKERETFVVVVELLIF